MSSKLFIISYDADNYEENQCDIGFYTDLEIAKNKLKDIYNKTPDYKYYGYKISVYELVGSEYITTHKIYVYSFDNFTEINN